jgi:hypothetical protein
VFAAFLLANVVVAVGSASFWAGVGVGTIIIWGAMYINPCGSEPLRGAPPD